MKWCWRRRARPREVDETARQAVEDSTRRLEEARGLTDEVERLTRALQQIRQRNNFASMMRQAFEEHR